MRAFKQLSNRLLCVFYFQMSRIERGGGRPPPASTSTKQRRPGTEHGITATNNPFDFLTEMDTILETDSERSGKKKRQISSDEFSTTDEDVKVDDSFKTVTKKTKKKENRAFYLRPELT